MNANILERKSIFPPISYFFPNHLVPLTVVPLNIFMLTLINYFSSNPVKKEHYKSLLNSTLSHTHFNTFNVSHYSNLPRPI